MKKPMIFHLQRNLKLTATKLKMSLPLLSKQKCKFITKDQLEA